MKLWSYFDKYEDLINKYMPKMGEGETIASQICTAVNKLIYKWYNDGDVFDNTQHLKGWANDLSSYANWLYKYSPKYFPNCQYILNRIYEIRTESEYEDLLADLADLLIDVDFLEMLAHKPKEGSIYDCAGQFTFEDSQNAWNDEDEEDDDEEWW